MVQAMAIFAGIRLRVLGKDRLPQGAFIIASKHQSWGDGFATYDQFDDLAFVTGDHLEKFPLLGGVLKKLGAIVVNSCGGHEARKALATRAAEAKAENRKILIYPEGHLAPVGQKYRYRSGVWHMYRDFDMPVVPLATNLGLFWPEEKYEKHPGTATLDFLEPIPTGLPKDQIHSPPRSRDRSPHRRTCRRGHGATGHARRADGYAEIILLPLRQKVARRAG